MSRNKSITSIHKQVVGCNRCPRLRAHCKEIAIKKRKSYQDQSYWGKPVPGFGDPKPKLFIMGLAPAAHGANRTGRMFTGDRSGDWLYRALHKAKFANQAEAIHAKDGLKLKDCYISAIAHCAPPDNKPTKDEIKNCESYLRDELEVMHNEIRAYLVLGQIALHGLWPFLSDNPRPKFGHGNQVKLENGKYLFMSYHPSQQNTFTKRLTEPMFDQVFKNIRKAIGGRAQTRSVPDFHS